MIQVQPNGDRAYINRRWFLSAGSTIIWVEDVNTGTIVPTVQWGSTLYLPLGAGHEFHVHLSNIANDWRGYPIYIEARNIYENGPAQPENCSADDMWEVPPSAEMTVKGLYNSRSKQTRPFVTQFTGDGFTIGEATFGTSAYRGQLRVYERPEIVDFRPRSRSDAFENMTRSADTKSFGASRGLGVGAGKEEYQGSFKTGRLYQRTVISVAALQIESSESLRRTLPGQYAHFVDGRLKPDRLRWWLDSGYTASSDHSMTVGAEIPVARTPHDPAGYPRS